MLGAGRQGQAIAWDLARNGEAKRITLVDADEQALARAARRIPRHVKVKTIVREFERGREAVKRMRGHDAVVSALPYRFNAALAKAAVKAGVSFCDLGGNTAVVERELALDSKARSAGVTIVPDCGLAPGLANELAGLAVDEVTGARHVRVLCGGLPLRPEGPLGYSLLFSMEGLTNEYTGEAVVLRNGRVRRVEAFTECEPVDGPRSLGPLEAFHTSGGSSTAPWTFRGKLKTYEYKTVRYPGHFEKVRAMIELGLLGLDPVRAGGRKVVPRDLFHAVAEPRLTKPKVKDVAFLRVDCTDPQGRGVRYQMLQAYDARTRFTAMEQTTGYPAAVIAHALARGELEPGARTPERCGFGQAHLKELRRRGLQIRRYSLG